MLPKDILERFLDAPFNYEELRIRVSAHVGEKLAGQETNNGVQPMDIVQLDTSDGDDEDVSAVPHRRRQRFNQKPKQESDNERKRFNRQAAAPLLPASRQSTPRDKTPGNDEAKQNVSKKKRLVCYKCGGKASLGPRDPTSLKVEATVPAGGGGVPEKAGHGLGLLHAGQGPLRRRIALSIDVSTRRDDAAQGAFVRCQVATIVEVEGVKGRPEMAAQLPTGGEARDIGRRGVLSSTPGSEPTSSDAEGTTRQSPSETGAQIN